MSRRLLDLERFLTMPQAAAITGLPLRTLKAYCGSGIVDGVIAVGPNRPKRFHLMISETGLRRLLWCFSENLHDADMSAYRQKWARAMGIGRDATLLDAMDDMHPEDVEPTAPVVKKPRKKKKAAAPAPAAVEQDADRVELDHAAVQAMEEAHSGGDQATDLMVALKASIAAAKKRNGVEAGTNGDAA